MENTPHYPEDTFYADCPMYSLESFMGTSYACDGGMIVCPGAWAHAEINAPEDLRYETSVSVHTRSTFARFGLDMCIDQSEFQRIIFRKTALTTIRVAIINEGKEHMKTLTLVAENGAGKGLFVEIVKKLLPNLRIISVRFSDPLLEILDILDKERSRDNIDTLVTALREAFHDEGILNKALARRLQGIEADIIILDGLRKEKEVPFIRAFNSMLIYIVADQRVRYERRKQEGEKSDELGMSLDQFVYQSNALPQREIRYIGETVADATIENNGSVEEFELTIKEFIKHHHLAEK